MNWLTTEAWWIFENFLVIGSTVATVAGLLASGGWFYVMTIVFAQVLARLIFGGRGEKAVERFYKLPITLMGIPIFAVFFTVWMIAKRGVLDFSNFNSFEMILPALIGWMILGGVSFGIVSVLRDGKKSRVKRKSQV